MQRNIVKRSIIALVATVAIGAASAGSASAAAPSKPKPPAPVTIKAPVDDAPMTACFGGIRW